MVLGWEKSTNLSRSLTGSTLPVLDFSIEQAGLHYLLVFKLFSVFCHNWTGLKTGSQLNQLDQPVLSDFLNHD